MGRVRGKGKKLTHEEQASIEEEKSQSLAHKRRGRPLKALKDNEIDDEEEQAKTEEEENEDKSNGGLSNKDSNVSSSVENGKKRKRNSPSNKEKTRSMMEENGVGTALVVEDKEYW